MQEPIAYREHGNVPRDRYVLEPGERQAFMALRKGTEKLLTIAFPGLNAQWWDFCFSFLVLYQQYVSRSPPINIEDIGSVSLRLQRPGSDRHNFLLVQIDVRIQSSTIFVVIAPADKGWPFEIENYSSYTFLVAQKVNAASFIGHPF